MRRLGCVLGVLLSLGTTRVNAQPSDESPEGEHGHEGTPAAHTALGIADVELHLAENLAHASERDAQLYELTRADAADAAAYAAEAKLGLLSAEGELLDARLHTHETLQHADERLLPAIERGVQAREALFRSGEGTVLEILVARRNALALRLRRLRLQQDWRSALYRFRELSLAVGISQ